MADTDESEIIFVPLLMRKILIGFGLFGFLVPLVVIPFIWLFPGSWESWVLSVVGLFWPTIFGTIAIHGEWSTWDLINLYSTLIFFNVLFYLFLGWLFWLGKTKSRWFYVPTVVIWLFPWGYIILMDLYYLLTM